MLRGGGGSTIGVVTSVTVRVFPKLQTTTVTYNFTVADTPGPDAFWAAVQAYIDNLERFVDAGTYGYVSLILIISYSEPMSSSIYYPWRTLLIF